MLSQNELARYGRHLTLPEFGVDGQERLKASSVLLIGAGGLGSPLGLYLAAAGVGTLGIVDGDVVEESNLQRQVLFTTVDVGKSKAERAAVRLGELNPYIVIHPYNLWLSADNALEIVAKYDLVIDGSDNFSTRYLASDACVLTGKPYVYGSIFQFEGQASVFHYNNGACYRCLFPEPPPPGAVPSCAEGGVLGVLPAMIASIQATEAIKILTGIGETLSGRLLHYDAKGMRFRELKIARNPDCPMCGDHPTITTLTDYNVVCDDVLGESKDSTVKEISAPELQALLAQNDVQLVDVREPFEREICRIDHSLAIPLATLKDQLDTLDKSKAVVCYCKGGGRSANACQELDAAGFSEVYNLRGGILGWIDQVDSSLTRY